MMTLTGTIPDLNIEAFNAAVDKFGVQQMKLAAAEFARAALQHIPVRTGFVAGAFAPLLELTQQQARFNPAISFLRTIVNRARNLFRPKQTFSEYYYYSGGKIGKSRETGRQFATPANEIITIENDKILFNYEIDISYFDINEQNPGRSPTAPWRSFEAGMEAMSNYLINVAPDFAPKFEDFIIQRKI